MLFFPLKFNTPNCVKGPPKKKTKVRVKFFQVSSNKKEKHITSSYFDTLYTTRKERRDTHTITERRIRARHT